MKITITRLKEIINEELVREQNFPPDRTGLSAGDWMGPSDPRGAGQDAFPETEAEILGDQIANAMERSIRDVLSHHLGVHEEQAIYDKYMAEVDEDILRIAMIMRDHALGLTGEPEGVVERPSDTYEDEFPGEPGM